MNDVEPVLRQDPVGPVLVATLNRPRAANALSGELIEALAGLAATLQRRVAAGDPDAPRALVLTGAGDRAFSAGADIHDLDGIDAPTALAQMERGQQAFAGLEALPIVVIAAIDGVAFGGGLELAMAADLRIASPSSRLGQPEITLGNLPGWGGTQRLPRLIGRGRALELILTGDPVSADRALELGLVNRVSETPLPDAIELATRIAERNPVAVAGAKRAVAAGLEQSLAQGFRVEAEAVARCCETPEQQAAVRAFLTRRERSDRGAVSKS